MDLQDNLAYVAQTNGLSIIDVTDPQNMEVIGAYVLNFAADVAVDGQVAYVAAGWDGLLALDVSDPRQPVLLGSMEGGTARVTVEGTTAYVAEAAAGMVVVDVSNPQEPVARGRQYTPWQIERMTVRGNLLFVADAWGGLSILDIAAPSAPEVVGSWKGGLVNWEVRLRGNLAYLSAGDAGLQILDVSDPADPVYVGGYPADAEARGLALVGDLAIMGQESPGPVRAIDVADPADPRLVSTLWRGQVLDVEATETHAFMARYSVLVARVLETGELLECSSAAPFAYDLDVQGDLLYAAIDGPYVQGLSILSIANPCSPVEIGSYSPADTGARFFEGVEVVGRRAYCVGGSSSVGLHIVDVGDPQNPTFLGEHDTADRAFHLAVDEPYVYVSDSLAGLLILRVPAQGDADQDWDVDLIDYARFAGCLSAPGGGVPFGCDVFDFYEVGAGIDLHDASLFQNNFTGPGAAPP